MGQAKVKANTTHVKNSKNKGGNMPKPDAPPINVSDKVVLWQQYGLIEKDGLLFFQFDERVSETGLEQEREEQLASF